MFVVMAAMVILFVLSTMLVTVSVYNVTSAQREETRMRALHVADAGLNAYLAGMRHDGPLYATNNPTLGPTATSGGTWTASIVASQSAYVVRSAGTVTGAGGASTTRVLVSRVAYPTFADYTVMADCNQTIGADAVFIGKYATTGSLENYGKVYADASRTAAGELWAGTTIVTWPGSKPLLSVAVEATQVHPNLNAGLSSGTKWVDFSKISGDMTILETTAAGSGTSFPKNAGCIGYQVVLNGGTYSLYSVKGPNKMKGSSLTYTPITGMQNLAIPSAGVLYFHDDVWVKGKYNAAITIASEGDIMLTQDITPTDPTSRFTCGLVAQSNIWIPIEYPISELPDQLTIQAALMAIDGHCGVAPGSSLRTRFTFTGSRTFRLTSGLLNGNGSGFANRLYDYDERLNIFPPPKFPVIHNGELKVTTWQEQ